MTTQYRELFQKALTAGKQAGDNHNPTPMTVRNPRTGEQWHVPDGVCGFASVRIKDARKGFAKWLKAEGLARHSDYYGGVNYNVSDYGQSFERKEAFAKAFATVLKDAGIQCYVDSRID